MYQVKRHSHLSTHKFIAVHNTDVSDRDKTMVGLREEFGDENVLYVSNYNVLKLRSVVKDVSKFFGIPFDEVNEVTRVVEDQVKSAVLKQGDDKNMFELKYSDAMEHCKSFREFMEKHTDVAEVVQQLHKQIKSISTHAGGAIILDDSGEVMPIMKVGGDWQTPWPEGIAVKTLERLGFCKIDLLGLSTLRIIQLCVEKILEKELGRKSTFKEVKEWIDVHISPRELKKMDGSPMYKHVYEDGRFPAVFQFTSAGAQSFIKKFKPQSVMDIAICTSIYRPGPLVAGVDKIYLEAKEHPENVTYVHPLVEKVLKPYRNCIIFQETMMNICHVVGGFDMTETDAARKALMKRTVSGKDDIAKKQQELAEKFVTGAVKNGLKKEDADELWKKVHGFLSYAFNASHAVSYAYDSVACAYLFYHHPDEWVCSWLESLQGNAEELSEAIGEVKSYGYTVVQPDVNMSTESWTCLSGKRLLPSLTSLTGVGKSAYDEIVSHRPYSDLADMLWNVDGSWRHSKANKRVWDILTKVGALESLDLVGDGKLFANYRQLNHVVVERVDELKKKDGAEKLQEILVEATSLPDWTDEERATFLQEYSGDSAVDILVNEEMRDKLADKGVLQISSIVDEGIGWFVLKEAIVKKTKNGKDYLLITSTDNSGTIQKIFVWGGRLCSYISKNSVYIAELKKSDFGYATQMRKLQKISS